MIMNITKEQFDNFVAVRDSGVCNMLEHKKITELTNLTKQEQRYILRNFKELWVKWYI